MAANVYRLFLFLFFVIITLAPLHVVRWSYFGVFPTTLLETVILLTLVLWVFDCWRSKVIPIPKVGKYKTPIILFIFASILSIFSSSDQFSGLGRFRAFVAEPLLIMIMLLDISNRYGYLQSALTIKGRKISLSVEKVVMFGFTTAVLWLSALGIVQILFDLGITHQSQAYRAHAVYNSGNHLAHIIGPFLMISLYRLLSSKGGFLDIILVIFSGSAFYLADSLGGYLAVCSIFILIIFAKRLGEKTVSRLFTAGFIASLLVFILFLTQVHTLTPKNVNPWVRTGSTADIRLCLWEGTYNVLKDNPILGTGLFGFSKIYENYYTCDAETFEDPDNFVLVFWTKTGIIGLVAIILLLFMLFRDPNTPLLLKIPFMYWFIHGMVDVPYFKNDLSLYWWVLFALIIIKSRNNNYDASLNNV